MTPRSKSVSPFLIIAMLTTQLLAPFQTQTWAHPVGDSLTVTFDTITGTVKGYVKDANGVGIPDVTVRVINQETNNTRATRTNSEGLYQIAFLPLGKYSIVAVKDGLKLIRPTTEPLRIQLNKTVEWAPDILLGPASAPAPAIANTPPVRTPAQTPAPAVTTSAQEEELGRLTNQIDSTRRANADEQMVALLPLANIRSFDDLALLAAGVAPPPQVKGVAGPGIGAGIGTAGQFSVNGSRARSNNFTVDGSDNNDEDVGVRRQGFVALVPQSVESIKEIQIVTSLWDAEQGRSAGSQVNAVSKSGTNQFHGSVYDFFNHSALNARNFFDYKSDGQGIPLTARAVERYVNGQPVGNTRILPVRIGNNNVVLPNPSEGKDQFQRNQGGAVLGFPIVPGKTFFFGSFEHQDIKARQETHFSVPTVAQRGFLGFGATGFTTVDRQGRAQSFAPTFVAGDSILSLFPFPNNPVGPYGENTLTQVLPASAKALIYSLKLDHTFKLFGPEVTHNFTARYNFTDDERQIPSVGNAIFASVMPKVRTQNLSLFLNSQFSSVLANQIRASYGRTALNFEELRNPYMRPSSRLPGESFLLNARVLQNFAFPLTPLPYVPYVDITASTPTFLTEGNLGPIGQVVVTPYSPLGLDVYLFPQRRANNTIQVADTLTRFRGGHTLKFGGDVRRTQLNSLLNRNYRSQVVFAGAPDLSQFFSSLTPIPNITQSGPTPGYFSGADLASLGIPSGIFQSLAIGNPDSTLGLRFWQLNFFFNDNWQARRGLSIDWGVRYELNSVPREVNGRIEKTFPLTQLPQSDPNQTITVSLGRNLINIPYTSLINGYNATVSALRNVVSNRDGIFSPDRNNWGGHLGFAWDPFVGNASQAGKTAVRGGAGLYYDLTLGSVVSQSRNVFPNFLPFNADVNTFSYARDAFFAPGTSGIYALTNPYFVNLFIGSQTTPVGLLRPSTLNVLNAPSGALPQLLGLLFKPDTAGVLPSGGGLAYTLPDNNLRAPYTLQYNLQIERELAKDLLLNVAYVGTRGVRLTRFRTPNGGPNSVTLPIDPLGLTASSNPNASAPLFALAIAPLSNLAGGPLGRPNSNLGSYTIFDSSAGSTYHSLQTTLTKRFGQGYQFTAAYTYSHAIDDVSDVFDVAGAYVLPQDDRILSAERASANFDIRHRFAYSLIGNVPFLARFNDDQGAKRVLFGDWQFAALTAYQTGQPFTVNTSYDINRDGNMTDRLNTLTGLQLVNDRQTKLQLTAAPTSLLAGLGENGRIGRNTFRASGVARTDLAVSKSFRLRSNHFLVFRTEAFNLWNRTHFGVPVRVLEAPSFGKSVDTLFNPRQIQFALKYVF